MSLVVNHNLAASRSANLLNASYTRLSTSTQRLSSGLRINSAADDAAGLAVRELMRCDVATLHQGIRNAMDGISMIQTADVALQVIDEKLIRMKELAEQAATGTYTSTQRLIIDSEFQAMASEINRIANATDFNGIKLLDGSRAGVPAMDPDAEPNVEMIKHFFFPDGNVPKGKGEYAFTGDADDMLALRGGYKALHDGSGPESQGAIKVHFGTGNDSAEDYYFITIGAATTDALLGRYEVKYAYNRPQVNWPGAQITGDSVRFEARDVVGGKGDAAFMTGIDHYALPVGLKNVVIRSKGNSGMHKPNVNLFTKDGTQLTGVDPEGHFDGISGANWWNSASRNDVIEAGKNTGLFGGTASYKNQIVNSADTAVEVGGATITMVTGQNNTQGMWEEIHISEVTDDLVFLIGGHDNPAGCNIYDLEITAELAGVESAEITPLDMDITTQDKAQQMLHRLDEGIVKKDTIRAHLGALQNRLENTTINLTTQAENLQASESRVSDVDVATEMTEYTRNQILTQSAVAMLAQANSLPEMVLKLLG